CAEAMSGFAGPPPLITRAAAAGRPSGGKMRRAVRHAGRRPVRRLVAARWLRFAFTRVRPRDRRGRVLRSGAREHSGPAPAGRRHGAHPPSRPAPAPRQGREGPVPLLPGGRQAGPLAIQSVNKSPAVTAGKSRVDAARPSASHGLTEEPRIMALSISRPDPTPQPAEEDIARRLLDSSAQLSYDPLT